MIFHRIRCYFIYLLVEGLAAADDVAKSIKPKLITMTVISIIYDLPRVYLNVNLFGSLCSFYHNIIQDTSDTITYRVMEGKFQRNKHEMLNVCFIWQKKY